MAETDQKQLVVSVREKTDTGTLSEAVPFGVSFDNVVDTRKGQEHYTLAQFFDSYMKYMENTPFIYYGLTAPTNSHIKIWIDTNTPQNIF